MKNRIQTREHFIALYETYWGAFPVQPDDDDDNLEHMKALLAHWWRLVDTVGPGLIDALVAAVADKGLNYKPSLQAFQNAWKAIRPSSVYRMPDPDVEEQRELERVEKVSRKPLFDFRHPPDRRYPLRPVEICEIPRWVVYQREELMRLRKAGLINFDLTFHGLPFSRRWEAWSAEEQKSMLARWNIDDEKLVTGKPASDLIADVDARIRVIVDTSRTNAAGIVDGPATAPEAGNRLPASGPHAARKPGEEDL